MSGIFAGSCYRSGCVVLLCLMPTFAGEPGFPSTVKPGAGLVEVYAADSFFEGPVWDRAGQKLFFTSFADGNQQVLRLDETGKASLWLDKTEGINGMFLSRDGKLLCAQCYGHRVLSCAIGTDGPKEVKTLAADSTWNQPNDICQSVNGDIFITDPDFKKRKTSAVFRVTSDGKVSKVIDDMAIPNGLITNLDGKTLYVADSYRKHWRSYPVLEDGTLGEGKVFFDPDTGDRSDPDGMTIDENGNLYFAGRGGVWVVDAYGKQLGFIEVPEFCSNLTFGGVDGKTLFLTCKGKVYSLAMQVRGGFTR